MNGISMQTFHYFFWKKFVEGSKWSNLWVEIFREMIKKQFLKTKPEANVTFNLPKEAASGAAKVALVGDFNDWDTTATEMKKLKTGAFKATIKLETGKEYQFRYLIDGQTWENDWEADKYVPNNLSFEDNSVVEL